jgi:hypothetical protein
MELGKFYGLQLDHGEMVREYEKREEGCIKEKVMEK